MEKCRIYKNLFQIEKDTQQVIIKDWINVLFRQTVVEDLKLREKYAKEVRKKYTRKALYLDIIGNDRKEIKLWELIMKKLQGRKYNIKNRRLMKSTSKCKALTMKWDEALKAKEQCMQMYKKNKKNKNH